MKNKSLSHIYRTTCTEYFKVYKVNFLLIKIIYLGLHSQKKNDTLSYLIQHQGQYHHSQESLSDLSLVNAVFAKLTKIN